MQGLLYGLISYVGWGVGDIFGAIASRKIDAYSVTFWVEAVSLVLFSLYAPFVLHELSGFTFSFFLITVAFGFLHMSGNVALNEAFTKTNPSLAGTINASFPALVIILSMVFLREPLSVTQGLIIGLIFAGVFLCLFDFALLKKGTKLLDRGSIYAIYAACAFAVYFTFLKVAANTVGWFWPLYISFFHFPLIYLYMKRKRMKLAKPNTHKALPAIIASAIGLRGGDAAFNYGLTHGLTQTVAPIAGAYPTLFAVLSFLVFKDPIKRQQIAGIIITLIGIVLLNLIGH